MISLHDQTANAAAITSAKEEHGTAIVMRNITCRNNIVEQDHGAVKRVTHAMLGCKAFEAAQCPIAGVKQMHMIKQQQLVVEEGDEDLRRLWCHYRKICSYCRNIWIVFQQKTCQSVSTEHTGLLTGGHCRLKTCSSTLLDCHPPRIVGWLERML
jgi:hypothetical protein